MALRRRTTLPRGRPKGALSFDADVAQAFGAVLRKARVAAELSQEDLAHSSRVERSYLGRIERGQSQPTLLVILKVAAALGWDGAMLVAATEDELKS